MGNLLQRLEERIGSRGKPAGVILASLAGVLALAVQAQTGHVHRWDAEALPAPELRIDLEAAHPGQIVPLTLVLPAADTDRCVADDGGAPCPFPAQVASNPIVPAGWNDGRAGGHFGYLDALGQFCESSDAARITHYASPAVAGEVTLSVTLDDEARDQLPGAGARVATHDDTPIRVQQQLSVRADETHTHAWAPTRRPASPAITVGVPHGTRAASRARAEVELQPGVVVPVSVQFPSEHAACVNAAGCPFPGGLAAVSHQVLAWNDGNTGGTFGYRDALGEFVALPSGSDASLVTHYRAAEHAAAGTKCNFSVSVATREESWDPALGRLVQTGAPTHRFASLSRSFGVLNTHTHQWDTVGEPSMSASSLVTTNPTPQVGDVIDLTVWSRLDHDYCSNTNPPCPLYNYVFDFVNYTNWTDNNAQGQFGYVDPGGTFYPSTEPKDITHYKCPSQPKVVLLKVTLNDDKTTTDANGQSHTLYDDEPPLERTLQITVGTPPTHTHQWESVSDIPLPYIGVGVTSATPGQKIPISGGISSTETDRCLLTSPSCSFINNLASNTCIKKRWQASVGGGRFGRMVNGVFQQTSDANLIDTYECPPSVSVPTQITLTFFTDDVPSAYDPAVGGTTATYDDAEASRSATLTVYPGHQHAWTGASHTVDQPVTLLVPDTGVPATSAGSCSVLEVVAGALTQDQDVCVQSGCPFPGGLVTEIEKPGQTVSYRDNVGGFFGTIDERGKFQILAATDVPLITHYLLPHGLTSGQQVRVWLVVRDSAQAMEGVQPIDTYSDGPKDGTPYILTAGGTGSGRCYPITKRIIDGSDTCDCACDWQPGNSSISPSSGAVGFEVPITSWNARGWSLGMALHYNSNARVDPTLDAPVIDPTVIPEPNLAHLSTRNSRWTHTWAQFVEVVDEGTGEPGESTGQIAALWHTGNGGVVKFDGVVDGGSLSWAPEDSYHSMTSSGFATTQLPLPTGYPTGSFPVSVPYNNFVVRDGDGTLYTFDKVFWMKGRSTAVPYFLLTHILDRYGREITLEWSNDGYLQTVRDLFGSALAFQYTGGVLTSVNDRFGRHHGLQYQSYLSERNSQEAKLSRVEVEGPGSPLRLKHIWQFQYGSSAQDLVTRKIEPTGKTANYVYESVPTSGAAPRPLPEDWDGRLISTDFTDRLTGLNHVISRSGTTLTYPGGLSQLYDYQSGRLTKVTDGSTGRWVESRYDNYGNLLKVWTASESESNPLRQYDYVYGGNGRTISAMTEKTPLFALYGDRTETDYNFLHQPTTITRYGRTGGAGYNQQTNIGYDDVGRPLWMNVVGGGVSDGVSFSGYGSGNPAEPQFFIDPQYRQWKTSYNGITGLPSNSVTPTNPLADPTTGDQQASTTVMEYVEELPSRITDPLGHFTRIEYAAVSTDRSHLEVKVIHSDNSFRTVELDAGGRPVRTTDEAGVVRLMTYNDAGQLQQVVEPITNSVSRVTSYVYNAQGDLAQLVNPLGKVTLYDYYRRSDTGALLSGPVYEGKVTQITYPDGNRECFGYDSVTGNLAWRSVPRSSGPPSVTTFTYDELHRLETASYPANGNIPSYWVTTSYDEFGRVKTVSDTGLVTTYQYDGLDRLVQVTPSDGRKTLTRQYDEVMDSAGGQLRRVRTYVSGQAQPWTTVFDPKGRPAQVQNPFGWNFSTYYDRDGKPLVELKHNGTRTEYTYDSRDRLSNLLHRRPNNAVLDQFTYQYDAVGRMLSEEDAQGRVHGMEYDLAGRLIAESHPDLGTYGNLYTYDKNDNRVQVSRNGVIDRYAYDYAHRLLWVNRSSTAPPTPGQAQPYTLFSYDEAGQLVYRDRRTPAGRNQLNFLWDGGGRLREVSKTNGALVLAATYAPDRERVTKEDPQNQGANQHVYSYGLHDTAGNVYYTPGLAESQNGVQRYYHHNGHGSTRYLTGIRSRGWLDWTGL